MTTDPETTTGAPSGGTDGVATGQRRSASWFAATGKNGFVHRSKMYGQGFTGEMFDGRPVIGIANSWSEVTPCNVHLRRVAESVKRGVYMAGGHPLEFPTMSLGETLMRPTAMLYRNLMAMEVEECLRAYPFDGVVLLTGCDKTTPAALMGAASVDLPTVLVTGGPAINGKFQGCDVGAGTHVWRLTEQARAGLVDSEQLEAAERGLARSNGHCNTMGTASTLACLTEVMGMQLPGSAALPAVDAGRYATAQRAGERIVQMVHENLRPSRILTREAFENAIRLNAAIGGSTNAVVHLLAIAGRTRTPLELRDFDTLGRDVPLLVDLLPSGQFLMEEFAYAGGVPALVKEMGDLLHRDALTVTGRSLGENCATAETFCPPGRDAAIRTLLDPVQPAGTGLAVLTGTLAPDGAVIKQSAASPRLLQHRGRALVFDGIEDYYAVMDDEDLDVDADTVLVVRGCGPRGYPGMPEVGNVPIPRKLLAQGVDDLVRISDGRMSGTSYGTVVLHVTPEAAVGGPLAHLQTGDVVELDVPNRYINVVSSRPSEGDAGAQAQAPPTGDFPGEGYARLYVDHVLPASQGADFDFLVGQRGHEVPRQLF